MDDEVESFLVISYGGHHATRDPNPVWYSNYRHAKDEVKRRLGVLKLHRGARGIRKEFGPNEPTRSHDGFEWRCLHAEDFSVVPASHPDFRRSGGFRLSWMRRLKPVAR